MIASELHDSVPPWSEISNLLQPGEIVRPKPILAIDNLDDSMKRILFVHNNFPAQFVHIARALAKDPGVQVAAIGTQTARPIPGVKLLKYSIGQGDVAATHPFARRFDLECRRAEEVLYAASNLKASGFVPDIVLAHPGWGETIPLRSAFPDSRLLAYCELYYRSKGQDVGFDPEFPVAGLDGDIRIHMKNAATLLALDDCDGGISPTQWQKSTYPAEYQSKIHVIHEGVNTNLVKPDPDASFQLPSGRVLTAADEVVTYVTRSFEPLRGFHIIMRALPQILKRRKDAHVVIVGGAGSPYGLEPPAGKSWKSIFLDEVARQIDTNRVHFVGALPHASYVKVLQISRAHLYFTYPFVLSWSFLEAMAAGCLVIASDTPPVREVLDPSKGVLVPFLDYDKLAAATVDALARPQRYDKQRIQARKFVLEHFDNARVCMPKLREFLGFKASKRRAKDEDDTALVASEET